MDSTQRRASSVERLDDIIVITLWDKEYLAWSGDEPEVFQKEVIEFVETQTGPNWLVLDYSRKTYLSSRHLGKLAVLNNILKRSGGGMRLCCLSDSLIGVLRVVDPKGSIFNTCRTREDAIRELKEEMADW